MYSSPMYGGYGVTVASSPVDVRADFIRKVYQLLFVSLLVTVGVGALCAQPAVLPAMLPLLPVFLIAGLLVGLGMAFARRNTQLAFGLLLVYSALQGAVFGPLLTMINKYAPGIPMQAAVLTVAAFGALSFYAITSKRDFSFLGGFLAIALIGLIVAGVLFMFFPAMRQGFGLIYSVAGILIFGGYVLYDTSQIMNKLGPNEAVFGAISLYLDFVNLFLFILRLLMELQRRD